MRKSPPLPERAWVKLYRVEARSLQAGRCAYCASPIRVTETTADHRKAYKNGGTTSQANIKAACGPCNKSKGHMSETAFLRLIKNLYPGAGIYLFQAWSRRRIWMKTWRACERIMRSTALVDQLDGYRNSTPAYAGSSPAERAI